MNDPKQETFTTWNKLAQLYQDKFMDLDLYNASYDFICEHLKPNASILELGCGPGNITKYLLSKRPDFIIHGTDYAPSMIELAKKNNPTATFQLLDARKIHELKSKFDAVIGGFCIPYLSPDETFKLITDAKQLLNENGLLYLSFVEGESSMSGFQTGSSGDRIYFNYHSLEFIQNQLKLDGFTIQKTMMNEFIKADQTKEMHTVIIAAI